MGEGGANAPGGDWRPQRIGPAPSHYSVSACLDVERSILAMCGVPVSLVIPTARADAREGWGRFLYGTLGPVAALVGADLEWVGLSGRLDFRALMASDLQGRARAFRQLRYGGMGEAEARAVCGIGDNNPPAVGGGRAWVESWAYPSRTDRKPNKYWGFLLCSCYPCRNARRTCCGTTP